MFWALLKAEWIKTMRMLSTYIAFVAAGALVFMVHMAMYMTADKSDLFIWLRQNNIDTSLLVNGYMATRILIEAGFVVLLAPMAIQVFARQVAGEDQRGTLRLALSRPISRFSLLNAKFIVCSIYCLMLMGFCLALSYGMGLALYGPKSSITIGQFNELDTDKFQDEARKRAQEDLKKKGANPLADPDAFRRLGQRNRKDMLFNTITKFVVTPQEGVERIFYAWLLTSWALLTIGSIAFMFSVTNRHPIAAMSMTIGLYFLVVILNVMSDSDRILPLFKALRPYLFTNAMDYWRESLSYKVKWADIWPKARLLGYYTFGFYVATQWLFWRKDITS